MIIPLGFIMAQNAQGEDQECVQSMEGDGCAPKFSALKQKSARDSPVMESQLATLIKRSLPD